jgi:hypothetical protein
MRNCGLGFVEGVCILDVVCGSLVGHILMGRHCVDSLTMQCLCRYYGSKRRPRRQHKIGPCRVQAREDVGHDVP